MIPFVQFFGVVGVVGVECLFFVFLFFVLRLVSAECRRLLPASAPGQKGG